MRRHSGARKTQRCSFGDGTQPLDPHRPHNRRSPRGRRTRPPRRTRSLLGSLRCPPRLTRLPRRRVPRVACRWCRRHRLLLRRARPPVVLWESPRARPLPRRLWRLWWWLASALGASTFSRTAPGGRGTCGIHTQRCVSEILATGVVLTKSKDALYASGRMPNQSANDLVRCQILTQHLQNTCDARFLSLPHQMSYGYVTGRHPHASSCHMRHFTRWVTHVQL